MNEKTKQAAGRLRIVAVAHLCAYGMMAMLSCVDVRDSDVQGPDDNGGLEVEAGASPESILEGGAVTLAAEARGGRAPYTYRWDQNGGPEVDITNADSPQASVEQLMDPGRYVFRVTVTDAAGEHATDFAPVDVSGSVSVEAPELAIVGEPVTLTARLTEGVGAAGFLWEVVQGTATIAPATAATTMLTAQQWETLKVRLTATFAEGGQPAAREVVIVAVPDLQPRVRVETNMGAFDIELDGENTPGHVVNFLRYVDEGFYDGLLFHRNACTEDLDTGECVPFVLQGGGYRREDGELVQVEATRDPIESESESGGSNGVVYSVSLALRSNDVNSGSAQFFVNLDEGNEFLDDSGFTVFGQVVEGTGVIDAIVAGERLESPIIAGEISLPAEDVVIEQITRIE